MPPAHLPVKKAPHKKGTPIWLWPNLISLDAPIIALCWQLLLAKTFHITLPPIYHLILSLSVWCIYLADRLYDSAKTKTPEKGTPRIRFTYQHFRALTTTLILLALTNLIFISQIPHREIIQNGLILATLLAAYYALRILTKNKRTLLIPREILCGLLFATGTALTTWTLTPAATDQNKIILATLTLGLLCSANCILISIWEKEQDTAVSDPPIPYASTSIRPLILRNASPLILIGVALILIGPWQYYLSISLSTTGLSLLILLQNHLSKNALRVLADLALLSPLAITALTALLKHTH